tara:strand:+ start:812 stop:1093 length:282 start_codon:yes stop_codon:yes gene_type:complete
MQDRTDKLLKKERDFTSLKQASKDPDYGYGMGKVTRKKGASDPRFNPQRGKSKAVAKAIKKDDTLRRRKSKRKKVAKNITRAFGGPNPIFKKK